jgi:hypothetical protein
MVIYPMAQSIATKIFTPRKNNITTIRSLHLKYNAAKSVKQQYFATS